MVAHIIMYFLTFHASVSLLCLGKMENCEQLLLERATLHGKLEEHDKALHILVHQLRDFQSAEAFCTWASSCRDSSYQQRLFHMLLEVYLDGNGTAVGSGDGDLKMAAVDLLNRHGEVFDAVRVLRLLPEGWSLQLLRPFLGRAVRASMHACRTSEIALGLSHSENLQLLHDRVRNTQSDRNQMLYAIENYVWLQALPEKLKLKLLNLTFFFFGALISIAIIFIQII